MHTPTPTSPPPPNPSRFSNHLGEAARDHRVHKAIDYRAKRLCRVFGLGSDAVDDLRQEAWLRICRAFARYDPALSAPSTFAQRVADGWYAETARSLRTKRDRHRTFLARDANALSAANGADPVERHAALLDARDAIARLKPEHLEAARCVCAGPVVRTAVGFGLHRGTVYRRLAEARVEMAAFGPEGGTDNGRHNSANSPPSRATVSGVLQRGEGG